MSPTSNSSQLGRSQNGGPSLCGIDRVESSGTTDPAALAFDSTSASSPTRFRLFALCPSPELGDN